MGRHAAGRSTKTKVKRKGGATKGILVSVVSALIAVGVAGGYVMYATKGNNAALEAPTSAEIQKAPSGAPSSPKISSTEKEADTSKARRASGAVAQARPTPQTTRPASKVTEEAKTQYNQLCASCHGAQGQGGTSVGIAGQGVSVSDTANVISSGMGGMPGYKGQLTQAQIDSIAAYCVTFK